MRGYVSLNLLLLEFHIPFRNVKTLHVIGMFISDLWSVFLVSFFHYCPVHDKKTNRERSCLDNNHPPFMQVTIIRGHDYQRHRKQKSHKPAIGHPCKKDDKESWQKDCWNDLINHGHPPVSNDRLLQVFPIRLKSASSFLIVFARFNHLFRNLHKFTLLNKALPQHIREDFLQKVLNARHFLK